VPFAELLQQKVFKPELRDTAAQINAWPPLPKVQLRQHYAFWMHAGELKNRELLMANTSKKAGAQPAQSLAPPDQGVMLRNYRAGQVL
jgi:hypothetical protein